MSGAEAEAGQCWLQQAKLCRVSGHFEAATTASLEALARQVAGAGLERAKLLWDMDKPHRAIISLQEVNPPCPPSPPSVSLPPELFCSDQSCATSILISHMLEGAFQSSSIKGLCKAPTGLLSADFAAGRVLMPHSCRQCSWPSPQYSQHCFWCMLTSSDHLLVWKGFCITSARLLFVCRSCSRQKLWSASQWQQHGAGPPPPPQAYRGQDGASAGNMDGQYRPGSQVRHHWFVPAASISMLTGSC